jgi:hypothetical protein
MFEFGICNQISSTFDFILLVLVHSPKDYHLDVLAVDWRCAADPPSVHQFSQVHTNFVLCHLMCFLFTIVCFSSSSLLCET